jgi:hypothetical protein
MSLYYIPDGETENRTGFLLKAKWALARLTFYFFSMIALFSGGIIYWFFAPLYSWYFFNDLNFTKYNRYIYPIIRTLLKILVRHGKSETYRQSFEISLFAPPRLSPVKTRLRINKEWTGPDNHCNGCIRCCLLASCPLIDLQKKTCRSFGSFYWRYFYCGRYPENQGQIDYYQCPKWIYRVDPGDPS